METIRLLLSLVESSNPRLGQLYEGRQASWRRRIAVAAGLRSDPCRTGWKWLVWSMISACWACPKPSWKRTSDPCRPTSSTPIRPAPGDCVTVPLVGGRASGRSVILSAPTTRTLTDRAFPHRKIMGKDLSIGGPDPGRSSRLLHRAAPVARRGQAGAVRGPAPSGATPPCPPWKSPKKWHGAQSDRRETSSSKAPANDTTG